MLASVTRTYRGSRLIMCSYLRIYALSYFFCERMLESEFYEHRGRCPPMMWCTLNHRIDITGLRLSHITSRLSWRGSISAIRCRSDGWECGWALAPMLYLITFHTTREWILWAYGVGVHPMISYPLLLCPKLKDNISRAFLLSKFLWCPSFRNERPQKQTIRANK